MIDSKEKLKRFTEKEKKIYYPRKSFLGIVKERFLYTEDYLLWKYVYYMRYAEYYDNRNCKIRFCIYQRKKNKIGRLLNVSIWKNNFDEGLRIWHSGIIVNGYAKIGKNCQLHGGNCIGNKGDDRLGAPVIGNNVDIGVGAKIIGDIYIADDIRIGANAVVTKSCYEKGAVLVGSPAREIKCKKDQK